VPHLSRDSARGSFFKNFFSSNFAPLNSSEIEEPDGSSPVSILGNSTPRSSYELLDFMVLMNHSILGEALRRGALTK
jgi:hypothetical protein